MGAGQRARGDRPDVRGDRRDAGLHPARLRDLQRIFSGGDTIVAEGTSYGEHQDGAWRAGLPDWGAGRWCDVFEIRDFLIQRVFIYLDPDYAGKDTERYPWLAAKLAAGHA